MAANNTVSVIGRIAQEPTTAQAGDTPVLEFSVAVSAGKDKDNASFFDVVIYGAYATTMADILAKGRQLAITGRLRQEQWETDGQKRSRVRIVADNVYLLHDPNRNSESEDSE